MPDTIRKDSIVGDEIDVVVRIRHLVKLPSLRLSHASPWTGCGRALDAQILDFRESVNPTDESKAR